MDIDTIYNSIFEKYLTVDYNFFVNNQQGNLIHTGTLAANGAATFIYQSIQTFSDFFRFLLLLPVTLPPQTFFLTSLSLSQAL